MSDLVKQDQGELIQYLFGNKSGLALPQPYERDIFLFDIYVTGTTHIENIEAIASSLHERDKLVFYREPDNPHDPQAIRIETINKEKIGYVPQQDNVIFSRLMDAGKALFGEVMSKEMRRKWLRIKVKVYLHEG